jgi:desulfoferrodoxin-like iron-binding protein
MQRRDAIKIAALAALATTYASAYDEKLIVNKQKMSLKDPAHPSDAEYKHLPEITVGALDAKGYALVEVTIGQKGIIHPSEEKHWIYEIELFGDDKKIASVSLEPVLSRGYLAARVNTKMLKTLTAVSKCNLHGEYTATLKLS